MRPLLVLAALGAACTQETDLAWTPPGVSVEPSPLRLEPTDACAEVLVRPRGGVLLDVRYAAATGADDALRIPDLAGDAVGLTLLHCPGEAPTSGLLTFTFDTDEAHVWAEEL